MKKTLFIATVAALAFENNKSIELDNGDTIIFRAAQIWHAINRIEGAKDRITLGCFIAQGYDKNLYYWS